MWGGMLGARLVHGGHELQVAANRGDDGAEEHGDGKPEAIVGLKLLGEGGAAGEQAAEEEDGNTVVIIEHNLDIIKVADHLIDMGPEGGDRGGLIVAEGTPEQVAQVDGSYTGVFLRPYLHP